MSASIKKSYWLLVGQSTRFRNKAEGLCCRDDFTRLALGMGAYCVIVRYSIAGERSAS